MRSFQVDERARQAFPEGQPQRRDDALAGVDGDVAATVSVGVALHHGADARQMADGFLHRVLKGRRQRHGDTIARLGQQFVADADGEVAGAVDDRQHAHARTDAEEISGGRGHGLASSLAERYAASGKARTLLPCRWRGSGLCSSFPSYPTNGHIAAVGRRLFPGPVLRCGSHQVRENVLRWASLQYSAPKQILHARHR